MRDGLLSGNVPLFARGSELELIKPRIQAAVQSVIESGAYVNGSDVSEFEAEFADFIGTDHCVGVGNGTDALMIGLLALGVRPRDEVVIPAVSFFATAEAVAAIGARPVFADVEEGTWTVSARTVEPLITAKTTALVPVHLFGNPAPMNELVGLARSHGIPVLEDAAQAAGAEYRNRMAGSLANAAAFSFYPGKNLGAIGDAGALLTDDDEVAAIARRLRQHGSDDRVNHLCVGFNSRLDSIQAAALRISLNELSRWTVARRHVASFYDRSSMRNFLTLPSETEGARSCFHQYIVSSDRRAELRDALDKRGIETRVYYSPVLPLQPALRKFAPDSLSPAAARYQETCLALPIGESLSKPEASRVVEAVEAALG
ncbi:MAG: DegT/DnrJ/EryC1/StrS family aminotransferase [Solirubrobacterales bacterium]|nr:DegT/DnrJ/EryC1/StrS family aminotransferase [Solirubrobacterales bacterium]